MRRRTFVAAMTGVAGCSAPLDTDAPTPKFLTKLPSRHERDPRSATLEWFSSHQVGLDLKYGVYSQLGRSPSAQFDGPIPLARYGALKNTFDPRAFEASAIAELALKSGVSYLSLTARHADGFCLFRTIASGFNSLEGAGRDLLGELCQACRDFGLGLIVSFSYAADWRHPYFFPAESSHTDWRGARPAYEPPPASYLFEEDEDFLIYIRDTHTQLQEIAYRYRPLAGMRLTPDRGYHARPDLFPVGQAYSLLRAAQAGMLIAFGLGASGDEDFAVADSMDPRPLDSAQGAQAWAANRTKPLEVTCQLGAEGGLGPAKLLDARLRAAERGHNLLIRVQLQPDGAIAPSDVAALLEFGSRSAAQEPPVSQS